MSGRLNVDGRVSIILGTYNGAEYVSEAVRSILEQTYGDIELIVVDDGSTDDTVELVERIGGAVRITGSSNIPNDRSMSTIYHTNGPNHFTPMGGLWSYIVGAGNSTGEYLSFHSQDDISHPTRFSRLVEAIHGHTLVHSTVTHIDPQGRRLRSSGTDMHEAMVGCLRSHDDSWDSIPHILFSSSMFRKDTFFSRQCYLIGQYNYEKLITMKMWDGCGFAYVPEELYSYREHPDQVSRMGVAWDRRIEDDGYAVSDFDIHGGRYNYGYIRPIDIRDEVRRRLQ